MSTDGPDIQRVHVCQLLIHGQYGSWSARRAGEGDGTPVCGESYRSIQDDGCGYAADVACEILSASSGGQIECRFLTGTTTPFYAGSQKLLTKKVCLNLFRAQSIHLRFCNASADVSFLLFY